MPKAFDSIRETEWAYLAGIMDGEGCINITIATGGAYSLQVKISQKNKADLQAIQNLFGGCMSGKKDSSSWQLYWGGKKWRAHTKTYLPLFEVEKGRS